MRLNKVIRISTLVKLLCSVKHWMWLYMPSCSHPVVCCLKLIYCLFNRQRREVQFAFTELPWSWLTLYWTHLKLLSYTEIQERWVHDSFTQFLYPAIFPDLQYQSEVWTHFPFELYEKMCPNFWVENVMSFYKRHHIRSVSLGHCKTQQQENVTVDCRLSSYCMCSLLLCHITCNYNCENHMWSVLAVI